MNQMDGVTRGTFLRAKQADTLAIELLNWVTDQGAGLTEVNQAHLDRWEAEGPMTRGIASRFLDWAIRTNLIGPSLKLRPHCPCISRRLDAAVQTEFVTNLSHISPWAASSCLDSERWIRVQDDGNMLDGD